MKRAAPAVLAGLTLLLFGGVLFSPGPYFLSKFGTDLGLQYLPWRTFGFGELRRGQLALWNPYVFSGAPFLGGFQSALLYPPNWAHLFLPLRAAVNGLAAFHVLLAGLFTYAWSRRRGLTANGALLAGVLFMFSGPFFSQLYAGHIPNLCAIPWIPLIFLSLDGLAAERKLRWPLLGMAAVALQIYAGHPQYVFYTGIAAALYAASLCRDRAGLGRAGLGLAAVYLGGAALGAAQLLPGISAFRECARASGTPYGFASVLSLPPENLLTLFAPFFFGDDALFPYFGRGYMWDLCLFIGASGLLLAALGWASSEKRTRARSSLLLLFFTVMALGAHTPVFRLLHGFVPGFGLFRTPSKWSVFIALFLAWLAGRGYDRASETAFKPGRWAAGAAAAGLLLLLSAAALSRSAAAGPDGLWAAAAARLAGSPERLDLPPLDYKNPGFIKESGAVASAELASQGVMLLAAAALLLVLTVSRRFSFGVAVFAAAEVLIFARGMRVATTLPPFTPPEWRETLKGLGPDERILTLGWPDMDQGLASGLPNLWGYDPYVPGRYAELMAASQGTAAQTSQYLTFRKLPPVLGLLRCRFVFDADPNKPPYRPANVMPRLALFTDYAVIPDSAALLGTLLEPGFDYTKKLLLEAGPVPAPVPSSADSQGTAVLLSSGTDSLDIQAELASPAVLLITDTWTPGWRAVALPGSSQDAYALMPADHALKAVPLGAGHHRLRVEYAPLGWRLGRWLTPLALLAWAGACLGAFRRKML